MFAVNDPPLTYSCQAPRSALAGVLILQGLSACRLTHQTG
jgi:hypothetical protein